MVSQIRVCSKNCFILRDYQSIKVNYTTRNAFSEHPCNGCFRLHHIKYKISHTNSSLCKYTDINAIFERCTEVATAGVMLKKIFLKLSQNWQENTSFGISYLIKFQESSFFVEHLRATTSGFRWKSQNN